MSFEEEGFPYVSAKKYVGEVYHPPNLLFQLPCWMYYIYALIKTEDS